MTSKIKVKVGAIELEFEGSEDYMRQELPALIELLNTLTPELEDMPEEESDVLEAPVDPTKQKLQMTTNTIAAKLDVKTDADLAFAACAHLALVKGADTFTRANILDPKYCPALEALSSSYPLAGP